MRRSSPRPDPCSLNRATSGTRSGMRGKLPRGSLGSFRRAGSSSSSKTSRRSTASRLPTRWSKWGAATASRPTSREPCHSSSGTASRSEAWRCAELRCLHQEWQRRMLDRCSCSSRVAKVGQQRHARRYATVCRAEGRGLPSRGIQRLSAREQPLVQTSSEGAASGDTRLTDVGRTHQHRPGAHGRGHRTRHRRGPRVLPPRNRVVLPTGTARGEPVQRVRRHSQVLQGRRGVGRMASRSRAALLCPGRTRRDRHVHAHARQGQRPPHSYSESQSCGTSRTRSSGEPRCTAIPPTRYGRRERRRLKGSRSAQVRFGKAFRGRGHGRPARAQLARSST
jgi:hypothetical protein